MKKDETSEKKQLSERRRVTLVCSLTACVFCAVIFGVLILSIIIPDREKSESENRMLKTFPSFSLSAVAEGSFMKNFETYLSDQFPFRDKLIEAKSDFERLLGKTNENGVYIGKDGFLFETPMKPDDEKIKELTEAVTAFSRKNKKLKKAFILSPNSTDLLSEKFPEALRLESRDEAFKKIRDDLSGVTWVDCKAAFEKQKDQSALFYKTDHHWTTRAAFLAFSSLSSEWELGAKKSNFEFFTVSNSFEGTLSSTAAVRDSADKIEICVPKNQAGKYTVLYESSEKKTSTLFENEKLNQKNQYELFLGGNYDKVIISTTADTTASLLLFKDSYANCLIPMLTPYFSKIVVVDPRYFSDSLEAVMGETQFSHILFVYNMNTFLGDSSLAATLSS